MKRLLAAGMALLLAFVLSTCAQAPKEPKPDYLKMMSQAAQAGDVEAGRQAEVLYRAELQERGDEEQEVCFDELYLLARSIDDRYGNARYSDELRLCGGELVLNRIASPEYPNNMQEVVFQLVGESTEEKEAFSQLTMPSGRAVKAALRLLQGERMMEPSVVGETKEAPPKAYAVFCDQLLGNTYFYRSEHPELYPIGEEKR